MTNAGLQPDQWQQEFLNQKHPRTLLLASRQSGKSQVAAVKALHLALSRPKSLILLLSPTLRQSGELFREKLLPIWLANGCPLKQTNPTQLELRLSNSSRIVSLPESEGNIRGFSAVDLLVVDEAARVNDLVYRAVRPMLAVSDGALCAMTTPFGERGWFHEAFTRQKNWHKIKIQAQDCPRLSPDFLLEEREALGDVYYRQEYECDFGALVGAIWNNIDFSKLMFDDFPTESSTLQLVRHILAIDTSRGETELSDWQAILNVKLYSDNHFYIEPVLVRLDDLQLFHKAEELIKLWQPRYRVIETAFAGYVLFNQLKRAGHFPLGRKRPGSVRKFDRIATRLTPLLQSGRIHIKRTAGGKEFVDQAKQYPLKDANDDALDAADMGLELAGELALPPGHPMRRVRYET